MDITKLLSLKSKTTQTLDSNRDIADDVTEDDFIPYASHIDETTLATKNGELLQTIRIDSSNIDMEDNVPGNVRHVIREAIINNVHTDKFAFWIHTLRQRSPITLTNDFKESFAQKVGAAWWEDRKWHDVYYNEVYLTILHKGQSADIFDINDMKKGWLHTKNRQFREQHLVEAKAKLEEVTAALCNYINQTHTTHLLSITERPHPDTAQPAIYSEPLEFLHYLINLVWKPQLLPDIDLCDYLSSNELTFGYNVMESRSDEGKRVFGALLTLKIYHELPPVLFDRCLQMPQEMIISQSFVYVPASKALEKHTLLKEIFIASEDEFIPKISGAETTLAADKGNPTDFGEQQLSILVVHPTFKELDKRANNVHSAFGRTGFAVVREDLKLEESFWAMLPGNFQYPCRKSVIPTTQIGGLARLNIYPTGQEKNNHWGEAVTILPTRSGTPYFFNFHVGDVGHTALLDFNAFADERGASLLNFLIMQSRKYHGRLIVVDQRYYGKPLVKALHGSYFEVFAPSDREEKDANVPSLNPFLLEDSPRNRAFLTTWLGNMLQETGDRDALKTLVTEAIAHVFTHPRNARCLELACTYLHDRVPDVFPEHWKEHWLSLFGRADDTLVLDQDICGVALDAVVNQFPHMTQPVFAYLLHRIMLVLDGKPTMLVINEAWDLLNNAFFAQRLNSLLDMLRKQNVMVLFTTRNFDKYAHDPVTPTILHNTPTKIIIPDDVAVNYFPEMLHCTDWELRTLENMERARGDILIKHGDESVFSRFSIQHLDSINNVLAGDPRALWLAKIRKR